MKQIITIVLFSVSVLSCKNLLLNAGLESMGVYDEKAKMHILKSDTKHIVLLPTHHIGTPEYYGDLSNIIDSLSNEGFYFYTESVSAENSSDTLLRKFRKFSGNPVPVSGYKNIVDSVIGKKFNVKLKKKIIDQPSYAELGVSLENSTNVDATLKQLIDYYELTYGPIILESCDFETDITEGTTCKKMKVQKEIKNDVLEDYRNELVLRQIDVEKRPKLVLIYGDGHTPGLLTGLKQRGFFLLNEN